MNTKWINPKFSLRTLLLIIVASAVVIWLVYGRVVVELESEKIGGEFGKFESGQVVEAIAHTSHFRRSTSDFFSITVVEYSPPTLRVGLSVRDSVEFKRHSKFTIIDGDDQKFIFVLSK